MNEMRFNCPKTLAARYWAMCRDKQTSPGVELRKIMQDEIDEYENAHGPLEIMLERLPKVVQF